MNTSELIRPGHLALRAAVYIRQSTPKQVLTNKESLRLQYALTQRAHALGWPESQVDLIDTGPGPKRRDHRRTRRLSGTCCTGGAGTDRHSDRL